MIQCLNEARLVVNYRYEQRIDFRIKDFPNTKSWKSINLGWKINWGVGDPGPEPPHAKEGIPKAVDLGG